MKATKLSIGKVATLLLIVALSFTACKKGKQTPPLKVCENTANFVLTENADGQYGKYIIRLTNGAYVFPCTVEDNTFNKEMIYDGMPITLSYQIIDEGKEVCKRLNQENDIVLSNRRRMNSKPQGAKITCISGVEEEEEEDVCLLE